MAFYCNGKQGICDCDILCADCKFYDDKGGKDVQTNADRIRAMSDEELAKQFAHTSICDQKYPECMKVGEDCLECLLEWLKQPAGER